MTDQSIEDASRKEFEIWYKREGFHVPVEEAYTAWEAWQAARQSSQSEPVALQPIERDEDMDRTYIPLPGGWEVQTKGRGSSFRIANTKGDCPRYLVTDEYLQEALEQMARDIHAAAPQQAIPSGNHLLFDAINKVIRVHGNGQPKQMDDAVMLLKHALSASPTAPIESDK
jgi:hypothetical protein